MAVASMRGLHVFISDIRNCQNKEAERARVDKELANIRTHFKTDRVLTAYEKKKYVWKLLYIYMLGYEVEFGLVEATSLISASKYAEKQVGYVVTSCLLNENHDFLRLVINTVRNDIISRNDTYQCLALTMVGNVGGKEFAEALTLDVEKLLMTTSIRPLVKKKAALCLLRLFRKSPELISPETWSDKMVVLLEERDLGVLLCVVSLFITLLAQSPESYAACLPKCVKILDRLVRIIDVPQDYTYYAIPSPWLQVKVMRALQYFPSIEDPAMRKALIDLLTQVLLKTDTVKNVNKNNATHALLFEAMALAMHIDADREVLGPCVELLGKFIGVKEPNIRYLGLENMARMLLVADVQGLIKSYQGQIVASLKDPDISIRRRALDLLYGMCDGENAKDIVEELLQYLSTAEYAIREELTLKIAVLAEKFAPNLRWYVDVILELTEKAGEFVSDDIWYRVVHIVTNHEELQPYAAAKVLEHLRRPGTHETMVKIAGYILGEFGHLLAAQPSSGVSASAIFSLLHDKFPSAQLPTKALLLSSYVKILLRAQASDTELQARALAVFTKYSSFMDAEVQQRAVEYSVLAYKGATMADIMAEMPKFPERESSLLKRAEDTEGDAPEASAVKVRQQQMMSQALVAVPSSAGPHANGVPGAPPPIPVPAQEPAPEHPVTPRAPSEEAAAASPAGSGRGDGGGTAEATAEVAEGAPGAASPSVSLTAESSVATLVTLPSSAASASPASTAQVGDLLGELLLLDGPAPTPEAQGAAPHAEAARAADAGPLALAVVDGSSAGAPQAGAATPVVQPIGSIAEWLKALTVKDSGVLYEDPHLQIGLKADWSGPRGRVTLFLGNKETGPLTPLEASVPPVPGLRLLTQPIPPLIPPRAQIQIPIDIAAVLAPREVPCVNLSYTTPGGLAVPLRLHLPVLLSKFLQPASLPAADFFARWKALPGPPLKVQEVLQGVKPMPLPAMTQLLVALHISVLPNLDPNPNNLVACCTLFTETMPPVLLLVRMETDPADRTQMRLTVASPEPTASLSLKEFIKEELAEGGPSWLRTATAGTQALQSPAALLLPPATARGPAAPPQAAPPAPSTVPAAAATAGAGPPGAVPQAPPAGVPPGPRSPPGPGSATAPALPAGAVAGPLQEQPQGMPQGYQGVPSAMMRPPVGQPGMAPAVVPPGAYPVHAMPPMMQYPGGPMPPAMPPHPVPSGGMPGTAMPGAYTLPQGAAALPSYMTHPGQMAHAAPMQPFQMRPPQAYQGMPQPRPGGF